MNAYEACSSVDRASDSDSECQGFDSLHAYNLKKINWFILKIGAVLVSTFNAEKIWFRWKFVSFLKIYKKLITANNKLSFNFNKLILNNTKFSNQFAFA